MFRMNLNLKTTVNVPIVFHDIVLAELTQEVLVMCDDDELEIRMIFSFIDDTILWVNNKMQSACNGIAHSIRLSANASIFSVSNAFVGSSRVRIPQF
jgi:hypothetical protein